jgi:hypothetical protein
LSDVDLEAVAGGKTPSTTTKEPIRRNGADMVEK